MLILKFSGLTNLESNDEHNSELQDISSNIKCEAKYTSLMIN